MSFGASKKDTVAPMRCLPGDEAQKGAYSGGPDARGRDLS